MTPTEISQETVVRNEAYYQMAGRKNHGFAEVRAALDLIVGEAAGRERLDVLEVGCGDADIIPSLPANVRYRGVDPTEGVILKLRQRWPAHEFEVGVCEKLDFPDGQMDVVMSFFVLEHTRAPRQAIREMVRVLKPGGHIIMLAPNHEAPWSSLNATRHYSPIQHLSLAVLRWGDLLARCLGMSRIRIIPTNCFEATKRYERPDDDLTYIASAWETVRQLRALDCRIVKCSQYKAQRKTPRTVAKTLLTKLPVFRYWGGNLFVVGQHRDSGPSTP